MKLIPLKILKKFILSLLFLLTTNTSAHAAQPISALLGPCERALANNFSSVPSSNLICIGFWHGIIDQTNTNCTALNLHLNGKTKEEAIEWQVAKSYLASSATNKDLESVITAFVNWAKSQSDLSAPIGSSLSKWFTRKWPCEGTPEILFLQ